MNHISYKIYHVKLILPITQQWSNEKRNHHLDYVIASFWFLFITCFTRELVSVSWTCAKRNFNQKIHNYINFISATVEVPCIWILDSHYEYGTEFYGTELGAAPTSVTEKCFLVMSLALRQMTGTLLVGPPGSRRIETVKVILTYICVLLLFVELKNCDKIHFIFLFMWVILFYLLKKRYFFFIINHNY